MALQYLDCILTFFSRLLRAEICAFSNKNRKWNCFGILCVIRILWRDNSGASQFGALLFYVNFRCRLQRTKPWEL